MFGFFLLKGQINITFENSFSEMRFFYSICLLFRQKEEVKKKETVTY